MVFYKILTCQKSLWNGIVYMFVKNSKVINILDIKLVKNSNITKLANFNIAEGNILTDKYVR